MQQRFAWRVAMLAVAVALAPWPLAADVVSKNPQSFAATTAPAAADAGTDETIARLVASRHLLIPVQGVPRSTLRDTFTDARAAKAHDAIDIPAPRGTPVVATDDGRVVKLFKSVPGGLTVYQFDRDDRVAYYYAHLDAYADGLHEGASLKRGDVIGYVGSTGNASYDAPHLHFAIYRLLPTKQWWTGTAINPYPFLAAQ